LTRGVPVFCQGTPRLASPTRMGELDEHVTVEEFFHVVKCHVRSAYDYMSRPGRPMI